MIDEKPLLSDINKGNGKRIETMNQSAMKSSDTSKKVPIQEVNIETESWPNQKPVIRIGRMAQDPPSSYREVKEYVESKPWVMPGQTTHFLCDLHADAPAFLRSLENCGFIRRNSSSFLDFHLTSEGKAARLILGGDYFDKGPANLPLLRVLKKLRDLKADMILLAGNHDLRTLAGFVYAGRKETQFAHLLIRMGKKAIPLFLEIIEEMEDAKPEEVPLSDEQIREHLYPSQKWFQDYPDYAKDYLRPERLKKELKRIREKIHEFEEAREKAGISLKMFYLSVLRCQQMFVDPQGEFSWLFDEMKLVHKEGSFLFIHAGVDDQIASFIKKNGVPALNDWFKERQENDLYDLYHGVLGNCFRTKYRDADYPLTSQGVQDIHSRGIYAVVHGHRNSLEGQKLVIRHGLLNLECDCSMDDNTRVIEGLSGSGLAYTSFLNSGKVLARSSDHPKTKVFEPAQMGATILITPES